MTNTFEQDRDALLTYAMRCKHLAELVPSLYDLLLRHPATLSQVTNTYRLQTTDTAETYAFALRQGVFKTLTDRDTVDVTVSGKEVNLLAVFQRTLNPVTALLLHKIQLRGDKSALMRLAAYL